MYILYKIKSIRFCVYYGDYTHMHIFYSDKNIFKEMTNRQYETEDNNKYFQIKLKNLLLNHFKQEHYFRRHYRLSLTSNLVVLLNIE